MKLYSVQQQLISRPLPDVSRAVHQQLDSLQLDIPKGEIALTAGSRGIANLATITLAVGDWLKAKGAKPFIVPSMGSHNGATAEGQRQMIESLGITEDAMQMPIRSSMDCVKLASVSSGDVWMDRYCFEAAGTIVINRIKLHTSFAGPVQSGLVKMMVVGMGKIDSARTFHSTASAGMKDMLLEMGQAVLNSGKILAGLGILEDGLDQTAEIHALRPEDILAQEPGLLSRHREYFPRLPVDDLNVLIVKSIGKTYSGTGMDTNVIGRRGIAGLNDITSPNIRVIGVLELSAASQGNAIGVGLADFITAKTRAAIDEHKTLINVLTTGYMDRMKIPATLPDDQQLIETIQGRYGNSRWMFIPNTLDLQQLYVSEDLCSELNNHARCKVDPAPIEIAFCNGAINLF